MIVVDVAAGMAAGIETVENPEVRRVRVAVIALGTGVLATVDREAGVIEDSLVPARVRLPVAEFAIGRKARSRVIRVPRTVVVVEVAARTVGGRPRIHPSRVAGRTLERGVCPDQRVRMIEGRTGPGRRLVAGLAIGGETR